MKNLIKYFKFPCFHKWQRDFTAFDWTHKDSKHYMRCLKCNKIK